MSVKAEPFTPQTLWEKCLQVLRENVGTSTVTMLFQAVQPLSIREDVFTIRVPSQFFYEYIEEHFSRLIVQTLRRHLGPRARLEYEVLTTLEAPTNLPSQSGPSPTILPGLRARQNFPTNLNPKYTFENFIPGPCNQLARSAGMAVAQRPGQTAFNPLFIYGEVGQGKTHLAHAIGNYARLLHPDKTICYLDADRFTQQYVDAVRSNQISAFLSRFQELDIFLLDDIQFLIGRDATQDIFFHIFKSLHEAGRQLVITADAPPHELRGLAERITSRFSWGLAAQLLPPDYETRLKILQYKVRQEGLDIPEPILQYLAENIHSHVRDLEGALIQIMAEASINRREINLALAQEVVQRFQPYRNRAVTIEQILQVVSDYFRIHPEELRGKSRRKEIAYARHIAIYLSRKHTQHALKAIGERFGGRDHSTILHSIEWVESYLHTNRDLQKHVQELERILFRGP
jgi:chromosomal replication initiator protein